MSQEELFFRFEDNTSGELTNLHLFLKNPCLKLTPDDHLDLYIDVYTNSRTYNIAFYPFESVGNGNGQIEIEFEGSSYLVNYTGGNEDI